MNRRASGTIVALTVHARDVPAIEREAFAGRIRAQPEGMAVTIETCHRVEAYFADTAEPAQLARQIGLPLGGRTLIGGAAVRHAMAVAVGRDSVVVGEDQVLHQLREAVAAARRDNRLDGGLERLFGRALQAGRRARSWRQGPQLSLADVALATIEDRSRSLNGRELLVVGAGRMGRLAVRAAAEAGASVSIASRTPEHARSLAASTGARTASFDPGPQLARFVGVVVALAGPWTIGPEALDTFRTSASIVVDLSVPDAVSTAAAVVLGPRLITADALALADARAVSADAGWLARLDGLIDQATRDYLDWLNGREGRATAEALIARADREREAELDRLWRHLPDLEPEARDAIDGMTRHLAKRLLREPLARLGRDTDGRDEQAVRDLFAL